MNGPGAEADEAPAPGDGIDKAREKGQGTDNEKGGR